MDGSVNAIAVSGSTVYVGGSFATAGGLPASLVAKWNGTTWTNLGTGIQGASVYALAVIGTRLYVGGQFTMAGGLSATNVACWDGSFWTTMGSGNSANGASPIGIVTALAASGNDIYAGGTFQRIGQNPAFRICRWNDQTTFSPPTAMQFSRPVIRPDRQFQIQVGASGGASYVVEATTNFIDWKSLLTNNAGAFDFVDSSATNLPAQFYRMRQIAVTDVCRPQPASNFQFSAGEAADAGAEGDVRLVRVGTGWFRKKRVASFANVLAAGGNNAHA